MDFSTGWRQSCEMSYTSTWPTLVARFPATAASRPRLLAEHERLVRRLHRRGHEPVGEHRLGRVRHVEHVDAALGVEEVRRVHQRGVVVGAVVAGRVDVALDLEAARRCPWRLGLRVRAHQLGVAGEALGGPAALVVLRADPPLDAGLGPRARSALALRRGQQRRFGRLRGGHGRDLGAACQRVPPSLVGADQPHREHGDEAQHDDSTSRTLPAARSHRKIRGYRRRASRAPGPHPRADAIAPATIGCREIAHDHGWVVPRAARALALRPPKQK